MELNTLAPAPGAKKSGRRLGRGHTRGKTCGRGHKGQKSRSGGGVPAIFEGGQMPIQRRLPKVGFRSRKSLTHAQIKLYNLQSVLTRFNLEKPTVDMDFLGKYGLVGKSIRTAKVILSGKLDRAVILKGVGYTKGVKAYIEKLGGSCAESVMEQTS